MQQQQHISTHSPKIPPNSPSHSKSFPFPQNFPPIFPPSHKPWLETTTTTKNTNEEWSRRKKKKRQWGHRYWTLDWTIWRSAPASAIYLRAAWRVPPPFAAGDLQLPQPRILRHRLRRFRLGVEAPAQLPGYAPSLWWKPIRGRRGRQVLRAVGRGGVSRGWREEDSRFSRGVGLSFCFWIFHFPSPSPFTTISPLYLFARWRWKTSGLFSCFCFWIFTCLLSP